MWDMRRRMHVDRLPDRRVMVHFYFPDAEKHHRRFWMLLERGEVDLCLDDPGHEIDLTVESTVLAMTQIWLGDSTFPREGKAGNIKMEGPVALRRDFPGWLMLSQFAALKQAAAR